MAATVTAFQIDPDGLPLDPARDFLVLQDDDGAPLIVGMGTDSNLHLICRLAGAWRQFNLSAQFGRRHHAQAFAAIQGGDGSITLAVSITNKSWGRRGRLFVAEGLSNQVGAVDWSQVTQHFVEHSPAAAHQIVKILLAGAGGDAARPMLIVDARPVDAEAGVDHHLVDLQTRDPQQVWRKVDLPNDVRGTLQLAFGRHGLPALWSAYDVGADRLVEVTTLPDPQWPNPISQKYQQLPVGAGVVVLAVGTDARFDDVYVGGDGICVYRGRKNTQPEIVVDSTQAQGVRQMGVHAAGDAMLVWFVGADNRVRYASRDPEAARWLPPQTLHDDIVRFGWLGDSAGEGVALVALTDTHGLELRRRADAGSAWTVECIPLQPVWNVPPLTRDELMQVIHRHAPRLVMHSQERFFMGPVSTYLQSVGLWDEAAAQWRVRPGALWDGHDMAAHAVPADTPENRNNLWLKIPDQPGETIVDPEVLKAGSPLASDVRVYLHAKFLPSADCTDIQCWLFSPYNGAGTAYMWLPTEEKSLVDLDPLGVHEGDWEHVTFRVDNGTMEVEGAYLSRHGDQPWCANHELEHDEDGRMRIYASRHGHANYPRPERNLHPDVSSPVYRFGLRNDTDRGSFQVDTAQVGELVSAGFLGDEAPVEPNWLRFPCRWGRREVLGEGRIEDVIRNNIPVTAEVIINLLPGGFFLDQVLVKSLLPGMLYDKALPAGEKFSWGPTAPITKRLWLGAEELGE